MPFLFARTSKTALHLNLLSGHESQVSHFQFLLYHKFSKCSKYGLELVLQYLNKLSYNLTCHVTKLRRKTVLHLRTPRA